MLRFKYPCCLALWLVSFCVYQPVYSQSEPGQGKIVTDQPDSQSTAKDAKPIIGDYRIIEGRAGDAQILPERLADVTVKITEKSITTYDGDRRQRFNATYKLDTKQKPWRIHMTPVEVAVPADQPKRDDASNASKKADVTTGLISIDPKTSQMKLIYALPGGSTPKDFSVQAKQQMFILERLDTPKESTKLDK